VVGRVIATGECILDNAVVQHPGFHRTVDARTGFFTRSLLCTPIRSVAGSGITGALEILNKRGGVGFDEEDRGLAKEVADFLSLALENITLNREILKVSDDLSREVSQFHGHLVDGAPFVAESEPMRAVLELTRMVSETPVDVLIRGENGTGKEVVARMIHQGGQRREAPFVAVNCAAVPETLIESEFFGYERGAFTGAVGARPGLLEEASGGTLFLDEIGDMPSGMQAKLLRAVQEGEGSRLGGNVRRRYDLRIISATNRDVARRVAEGAFREDLYYRLFAVEIVVPSLRERGEDIVPLALAFLDEISRRYGKAFPGFSDDLLTAFEVYPWPGNVRQLRREIERLVALTPEGQHLRLDRCSSELRRGSSGRRFDDGNLDIPSRVGTLERRLIDEALGRTGGNKARAAELLGITRQGLHKKLKRIESSPP
jgi:transcriptional regulator with PAS, ATPase and Fis domain